MEESNSIPSVITYTPNMERKSADEYCRRQSLRIQQNDRRLRKRNSLLSSSVDHHYAFYNTQRQSPPPSFSSNLNSVLDQKHNYRKYDMVNANRHNNGVFRRSNVNTINYPDEENDNEGTLVHNPNPHQQQQEEEDLSLPLQEASMVQRPSLVLSREVQENLKEEEQELIRRLLKEQQEEENNKKLIPSSHTTSTPIDADFESIHINTFTTSSESEQLKQHTSIRSNKPKRLRISSFRRKSPVFPSIPSTSSKTRKRQREFSPSSSIPNTSSSNSRHQHHLIVSETNKKRQKITTSISTSQTNKRRKSFIVVARKKSISTFATTTTSKTTADSSSPTSTTIASPTQFATSSIISSSHSLNIYHQDLSHSNNNNIDINSNNPLHINNNNDNSIEMHSSDKKRKHWSSRLSSSSANKRQIHHHHASDPIPTRMSAHTSSPDHHPRLELLPSSENDMAHHHLNFEQDSDHSTITSTTSVFVEPTATLIPSSSSFENEGQEQENEEGLPITEIEDDGQPEEIDDDSERDKDEDNDPHGDRFIHLPFNCALPTAIDSSKHLQGVSSSSDGRPNDYDNFPEFPDWFDPRELTVVPRRRRPISYRHEYYHDPMDDTFLLEERFLGRSPDPPTFNNDGEWRLCDFWRGSFVPVGPEETDRVRPSFIDPDDQNPTWPIENPSVTLVAFPVPIPENPGTLFDPAFAQPGGGGDGGSNLAPEQPEPAINQPAPRIPSPPTFIPGLLVPPSSGSPAVDNQIIDSVFPPNPNNVGNNNGQPVVINIPNQPASAVVVNPAPIIGGGGGNLDLGVNLGTNDIIGSPSFSPAAGPDGGPRKINPATGAPGNSNDRGIFTPDGIVDVNGNPIVDDRSGHHPLTDETGVLLDDRTGIVFISTVAAIICAFVLAISMSLWVSRIKKRTKRETILRQRASLARRQRKSQVAKNTLSFVSRLSTIQEVSQEEELPTPTSEKSISTNLSQSKKKTDEEISIEMPPLAYPASLNASIHNIPCPDYTVKPRYTAQDLFFLSLRNDALSSPSNASRCLSDISETSVHHHHHRKSTSPPPSEYTDIITEATESVNPSPRSSLLNVDSVAFIGDGYDGTTDKSTLDSRLGFVGTNRTLSRGISSHDEDEFVNGEEEKSENKLPDHSIVIQFEEASSVENISPLSSSTSESEPDLNEGTHISNGLMSVVSSTGNTTTDRNQQQAEMPPEEISPVYSLDVVYSMDEDDQHLHRH